MQSFSQVIPLCFLLYMTPGASANNLNKDIERKTKWATQWKLQLDIQLKFDDHLKMVPGKISKTIDFFVNSKISYKVLHL